MRISDWSSDVCSSDLAEEDAARIATAEAAIRAIEQRQHALAEKHGEADLYAAAGARVMDFYRERIESRTNGLSDARKAEDQLVREFQLVGIKAEREALLGLDRKSTRLNSRH